MDMTLPVLLTLLGVARGVLVTYLLVAATGAALVHAMLTVERLTDRWAYYDADDACYTATRLSLPAAGTLAALAWPYLLWCAVRGVSTSPTPVPSPYGVSDADDRSHTP